MAPSSNPYPQPVESDGDQSGRGEGRSFRYRVNRPYRQVESEVQRRHLTRLAVQDSAQGSDEGDGGSLEDYVDSAAEQSPGDGDVGEILVRRGQFFDLRDGTLMTMRPAVDRVDF
jgi:hypothetical protein